MSIDMTDRKNLGRLLSIVAGLIIGVLIGDVLYGLFMGVILAEPIGKAFAGEELIEDKKTRRRFVLVAALLLAAGCLAYGYLVGDIWSGFGAAIGLSFVIGLKGPKLFDERTSNIFNKATRNAFVVANAGFTYVGFFHQMVEVIPAIDRVSVMDRFVSVLVLSWLVFLLSWLYHYYLKGE